MVHQKVKDKATVKPMVIIYTEKLRAKRTEKAMWWCKKVNQWIKKTHLRHNKEKVKMLKEGNEKGQRTKSQPNRMELLLPTKTEITQSSNKTFL